MGTAITGSKFRHYARRIMRENNIPLHGEQRRAREKAEDAAKKHAEAAAYERMKAAGARVASIARQDSLWSRAKKWLRRVCQ